jgi:hypothetical protein
MSTPAGAGNEVPPQRAVSRILYATARRAGFGATTIPLGPPSLADSSGLPGGFGRAVLERLPIWPCSVRGFACRRALRPTRCALTAPFHPYLPSPVAFRARARAWRYVFCATVLRVAPTGSYPAHCPVEFGLSSLRLRALTGASARRRSPDPLRRNAFILPSRRSRVQHAAVPDGVESVEPGGGPTRPTPAGCCTAPASCRDCCAACR